MEESRGLGGQHGVGGKFGVDGYMALVESLVRLKQRKWSGPSPSGLPRISLEHPLRCLRRRPWSSSTSRRRVVLLGIVGQLLFL